MALPVTISSSAAGIGGHQPPYKSSAGNYYAIIKTSATTMDCFKATDPTSSFTEQDSAGNPAGFSFLSILSHVQAGDSIMCVTWDSGLYEYHRFNMATDNWDVVDSDLGTIDQAPTFPWCSIAVRNDGDIICVIAGDTDQNMGGKKERVDYVESTTDGSSWGSHTALDVDADIHYGNPNVVKAGLTDDMRCVWQTTSNTADPPTAWTDVEARTLDSANALSTTVTNTADTGGTLLGIQNLVGYNDAGTARTAFNGALDGTDIIAWRATDDGSGDIQAPSNATAATENPYVNGEVGILSLAEDSGTLYCLFSNADDTQDIYYMESTDDGATWTATPTEVVDAVTCNHISCNIYQRGTDTVLAFVYDNAGTIYYNEKVLSTGLSYTQLDHAELVGLVNTHVGPFETA